MVGDPPRLTSQGMSSIFCTQTSSPFPSPLTHDESTRLKLIPTVAKNHNYIWKGREKWWWRVFIFAEATSKCRSPCTVISSMINTSPTPQLQIICKSVHYVGTWSSLMCLTDTMQGWSHGGHTQTEMCNSPNNYPLGDLLPSSMVQLPFLPSLSHNILLIGVKYHHLNRTSLNPFHTTGWVLQTGLLSCP